eukprot:4345700-Amphidinium_carterae.1
MTCRQPFAPTKSSIQYNAIFPRNLNQLLGNSSGPAKPEVASIAYSAMLIVSIEDQVLWGLSRPYPKVDHTKLMPHQRDAVQDMLQRDELRAPGWIYDSVVATTAQIGNHSVYHLKKDKPSSLLGGCGVRHNVIVVPEIREFNSGPTLPIINKT